MPVVARNGHCRQRLTVAAIAIALVVIVSADLFLGAVAAQDAPGGENNLPRYWEIHAALLTVGTAFLVASYIALWLKMLGKLEDFGFPAITTRISRLWYKWHMYLGIIGVGLTLAGVIWGYLMVQWAYGGAHLRIPHSYVGIATGVIALAPLVTGAVARATRKGRIALRWWHVAIGIASIVIMLVGLFSGWATD
jgi:hypothetical protein